jgi:FkbM family methyltransferase
MTLAEILLDDFYVRDLKLRSNPVVIDVGGFIGDFSLYAVKRLNASRVIVCEPSPRNWALLLKNIANNGYEGRIEPVNKAVTDGGDVMMNIDAPAESQCEVSAYAPSEQPLSAVPGISLSQLLRDHAVETARAENLRFWRARLPKCSVASGISCSNITRSTGSGPSWRARNSAFAAKGMICTCVAVSYRLHGREAIMFWEVGHGVTGARRP